jgi:hypothetical protein
MYINNSGTWKKINDFYINVSGTWKKILNGYINVSGTWKSFFASIKTPTVPYDSSISQQTNTTTYLITLTGTYYRWTDADLITYRFEKQNGASWTTLSSGIGTNPSVGSSVSYTYDLVDNLSDVSPNIQNVYRFVSRGYNNQYQTTFDSTDNLTSVYGPENITITTTGKSYNSVDLNWTNTAAPNAQKYLVYYKLSTDSSYTFSKVISNTSTTVGSLSSGTSYNFKVVPITGVSNTYKGYRGNDSNVLNVTTDAPAVPTQLTSPTITGTGYAFSSINGTSGTYQSGTYQSKTTYIGKTTSSNAPTNGGTTAMANAGSAPYKITQYDVSTPKYYFYYVDAVTANDGTTVYYYYSSSIDGKVGNLTDNYNRTVASGLGYMTPVWDATMTPSSYSYNLTAYGSSWSTNGSVAVITSTVTGTDPYTYPQQAIELSGKTDITSSVNFPGGSEGLGLTFWVTSIGSWWASTVKRSTSTGTKYTWGLSGTENYTYYLGNRQVTFDKQYNDQAADLRLGTYTECQTTSYLKSRTVTTYTCSTGTSGNDGFCYTYSPGVGYVIVGSASASVTTYCDVPYSSYFGSCGSTTSTYDCTPCTTSGSGTICGSTTIRTCISGGNTGTYCGTGSYNVCDVSGGSDCGPYNGTRDTCTGSYSQINNSTYPSGACSKGSSSVTLYSTNLNILMANGSTVSSQASQTVESAVESTTSILGMKLTTSENSITAKVYTDNSLTSQLGSTLSYTASSPTKTSITGASHAGIIKTPAGSIVGGTQFDNLSIV